MRPKFRIWDKVNECWFKPTYEAYKQSLQDLTITRNGELVMRTFTEPATHESAFPDRYEVNMYTGLKDKDGVEIYEGDRYRHKYYSPNWKEHLETEGVVEWDDDKLQYNISGYKSAHLEVIGNKYQSKEG